MGASSECTLQHLHDIKSDWRKAGLVNPAEPTRAMMNAVRQAYPAATEVKCANAVAINGGVITAGDVVSAEIDGTNVVGELWYTVSVKGEGAMSCLSLWTPTSRDVNTNSITFEKSDDPLLVPSNALRFSHLYLSSSDGKRITAIM